MGVGMLRKLPPPARIQSRSPSREGPHFKEPRPHGSLTGLSTSPLSHLGEGCSFTDGIWETRLHLFEVKCLPFRAAGSFSLLLKLEPMSSGSACRDPSERGNNPFQVLQ